MWWVLPNHACTLLLASSLLKTHTLLVRSSILVPPQHLLGDREGAWSIIWSSVSKSQFPMTTSCSRKWFCGPHLPVCQQVPNGARWKFPSLSFTKEPNMFSQTYQIFVMVIILGCSMLLACCCLTMNWHMAMEVSWFSTPCPDALVRFYDIRFLQEIPWQGIICLCAPALFTALILSGSI